MHHIVIVGPTASGKTALSLRLATLLNGEIICADSRTVYKGMDIGTAKPTAQDQALVKHHCIDLVYPNEPFTVADFVIAAKQAEQTIRHSSKTPITVGGSGLFIDGFIYDYSFVAPNPEVRKTYQSWSVTQLQQEIIKRNIALPVNSKNKRHLTLALERANRPTPTKKALPKDTMIIGIAPEKDVLLGNIEQRANQMIQEGVLEEVSHMYKTYNTSPALLGGVYRTVQPYLRGEQSIDATLQSIITYDKKLAKRQLTWFKRNPDITWFTSPQEALEWFMNHKQGTL